MNKVYYKIREDEGKLSVVCLQDFDEIDYDQSKFISKYKFNTEQDADEMINGIYTFIGKMLLWQKG